MARCGCSDTNSASAVRSVLSANHGVSYNSATGNFTAHISTCAGNTLALGPDDGLCVTQTPATVTPGCGLSGTGTVADPIKAVVVPWGFPCDITARSSNVYCNPATGELRAEPRARTYTSAAVQEHTPANLAVPAGGTVVSIDTFTFTVTNPDTCRTMRLTTDTSLDIDATFPAGSTGGFALDGDRTWAYSNTGASTATNQHVQVSKSKDCGTAAPGASITVTVDVGGERGAGGATYNRIQVQQFFFWNQN